MFGTSHEADGIFVLAGRRCEEQGNTEDCDSTDGQIDVETPAPRNLVSEGTTHERSRNGCEPVHSTNNPSVDRSLVERYSVCDDDEGAGEYAGRAYASDGATDNESNGCRGSAANNTTNFKDEDSRQIYVFDAEEGVEFAEEKLESAGCKKISFAKGKHNCADNGAWQLPDPYHPTSFSALK